MEKNCGNNLEPKYKTFAQRCMSLPYGFDQILCDGNACPHRRKCVRYMLHVKKRLTATPGAAYYVMASPKYNYELCFWSYKDVVSQLEKKSEKKP